jgi:hypothetical protein
MRDQLNVRVSRKQSRTNPAAFWFLSTGRLLMHKSIKLVLAGFFALALAGAATPSAKAQLVGSFDDLTYWGTGTNSSALVVDWNDGKTNETLAWGFRWDGALNVGNMLLTLTSQDPRLFIRVDTDTPFGLAIFGIGYQTGASPFGVSGAQGPAGESVSPVFINGISNLSTSGSTQAPASSASTAPSNSGDHYREGWFDNGFWGLYFSGTDNFAAQPQFSYPTTWADGFVGVTDASLVNGAWYALSMSGTDFTPFAPGSAVAAPEPGSIALILAGASAVVALRRRRSSI